MLDDGPVGVIFADRGADLEPRGELDEETDIVALI